MPAGLRRLNVGDPLPQVMLSCELPKPVQPGLPKWLPLVSVAMAALFLIGLCSTEMADPDSWWHLRTGQYILGQHRLPYPDPFAWTTAGAAASYRSEEVTRRFNLTHEWLAQVVMYLVWVAGGYGSVVFGKALLLAGMCGLAGWIAARRTGSWIWGVAAAAASSSIASLFVSDRPALVTFFLVAVFTAIYEARRPLWLLPLLGLLWANCHSGFFLGWVIAFAYSVEAFVEARRGRAVPDARSIWLASGAAVLATAVNPNGYRVLEVLLRYRQGALTSTLIEWRTPYLWGPPYAFDVLLYAAAIVLVVSWRRVRISDWILFVLFSAASLTAFRNIILTGFLAPILIATYFPWKRELPRVAQYATPAILAAALAWGISRGTFFQLRAAEWRYPAGAASFLREHGIPAPLFNTYEYGGYFIWRGQRVFIDGRALSESVFDDYRKILGSPPGDPVRAQMLAKYGVGAIAVNAFEYTSGVLYPLILALGNPAQTEWKLVYEDPQSLVFLRDVPAGMPVLPLARVTEHLMNECALHIERNPEFSLCARTLGDRFLRAGDRIRARRMLGLYLEHPYFDDPEAKQAYQQLLMSGK